jgi:hypothetical protein
LHDAIRQCRVVADGETEPGERVGAVRVESARHEHPAGRMPFRQRRDDLVERAQVEIAGRARGKGDVARGASSVAVPDLVDASRPRVQRPLVERDVRHAGVGVEDLLRAVAVVRVVVDHENPFTAISERGGRDRDVVEQAEAHRALGPRVVTGGPHGEERGVAVAGSERVDGGETGAGRAHRSRPRAF